MLRHPGVKVAVCEVPFHYIASEHQGGLGGTCVLRGCVPKKLLSYGGEFINEFKAAEGYGYDPVLFPDYGCTV